MGLISNKNKSTRSCVAHSYRVDEGVPEVQSSGVRQARSAPSSTAAAAATALEPQTHATLHTNRSYTQNVQDYTQKHTYFHTNVPIIKTHAVFKTLGFCKIGDIIM